MSAPRDELRNQFIEGMSKVACTVTVVTTDGAAGRAGVTVSAMSSVSADGDNPTMLVCVHHLSPAVPLMVENGCFCTNILCEEQRQVSDVFAGIQETENGDKFDCAEWHTMATGSPRLQRAVASFDCRILSADRVGTHHIFIGAVQQVHVEAERSPLLYAERDYRRLP